MRFEINEANNFIRVFRLPNSYPEGFCFNGGYPVSFQLIDWFNVFSPIEIGSETVIVEGDDYEQHITMIKDFIRQKIYATSDMLAITDYGDAFIIEIDGGKK